MTRLQGESIEHIASSMHVLPRFMHYFLSSFKPQLEIPIKKNEVKALFEIANNPNMPMQHYVDFVDMENSSFTYLTDKLETKGLVKKIRGKEDKRKTVLCLTDCGEVAVGKLKSQFDNHIANLMSGLENEDLEKLANAFNLLNEVLEIIVKGNLEKE